MTILSRLWDEGVIDREQPVALSQFVASLPDEQVAELRRASLKVVALSIAPAAAFTDAATIAARLDALASTPPSPSVRVRLAATVPMLGLCGLGRRRGRRVRGGRPLRRRRPPRPTVPSDDYYVMSYIG